MPYKSKSTGKWHGRVMVGGERRYVGVFDTKREAVAAESEYRSRHEALSARLSVDELYEEWRKSGVAGRWSRATEIGYRHKTAAFRARYGKHGVSTVEVRDAFAWHREHPHDTDALRVMFGHGRKIGVLLANPFEGLRSPSPVTEHEHITLGRGALTPGEVEVLAGFAERDGGWHGAVVRFAAFTGLRIGELVRVRWQDVEPGRLRVEWAWNSTTDTLERPKGGKTRVVVCPPQAVEAVGGLPRSTLHPEIFLSPQTGAPFKPDRLRDYFKGARALFMEQLPADHWLRVRDRFAREQQGREGRPLRGKPLVFHELRHTCATMLLDAGATFDDVAVQLGHSDDKLVRRVYGHPDRERQLDRVAAAFGRVAGEAPVLRKVEGGLSDG